MKKGSRTGAFFQSDIHVGRQINFHFSTIKINSLQTKTTSAHPRQRHIIFQAEASKPWGEDGRRKLTEADVLQFLEGCLGFDCPLVAAAIGQFLFGATGLNDEAIGALNAFQKSLAYGLPSKLAVSTYESGFADRHIAQNVAIDIRLAGYEGGHFRAALPEYHEVVAGVLAAYPSYFGAVLDSL